MSPFWILLELRMMEVVITTGAIKRANLQSKCHQQQPNTQFFYRSDVLALTQPTVSKHWRENKWISHLPDWNVQIILDLRYDFQTKGEFLPTTKDKTKLLLVLQKLCKLGLRPRFHVRTKTDFFLLKSPTECLCSHWWSYKLQKYFGILWTAMFHIQ